MKIFCRHIFEIIKEGGILKPSREEIQQSKRNGWCVEDYTFFTHKKQEIILQCKKCGKLKKVLLLI
jgi:Zn finger protein HypA/HybF involved in hydrogenase expression